MEDQEGEVGRKEQEAGGFEEATYKDTEQTSNPSTHTLELCAWATEDVILHLKLATLQKRNKKLTDENPVNEGPDMYKLTDEFRMIPSVF